MVGINNDGALHVTTLTPLDMRRVNPEDFTIANLDDELRVDELCARLLLALRDTLAARGLEPLEVGDLCRGADYFLRDFLIAECGDNLFRLPPERIRQFAGHWYIVRTMEPNLQELADLLAGVATCYRILSEQGLVETDRAEAVAIHCDNLPWYRQRIEDFWAIEGDGFLAWRSACPLPPPR